MFDDISAAGLRRTTPSALRAATLADGFAGLPDGVTRWRLAAALRAAATSMRLTTPMLRLLEHYIDLTYDEDWEVGAEPVITRPLIEIADHLGRSERQVRNIERALADKGLLAWRDSGNHHRKGRRDRTSGRLIYAYGPSLAPLGARAKEIIDRARAARAEVAAGRRLRIAISALRRRIRAGLSAATANGINADDLIMRVDATPARNSAGESLSILSERRDILAAIANDIEERLNAQNPIHENIAALPEIHTQHETDTNRKNTINGSTASIEQEEGSALRHGMMSIPLDLAIQAAGPTLQAALARHQNLSWLELVEAAAETAPMLGITPQSWGEACNALGRDAAAVAVLVVERGALRPDREAIRRPDAYLRKLIRRGHERTLHLDRSVRAWARRNGDETEREDTSRLIQTSHTATLKGCTGASLRLGARNTGQRPDFRATES